MGGILGESLCRDVRGGFMVVTELQGDNEAAAMVRRL